MAVKENPACCCCQALDMKWQERKTKALLEILYWKMLVSAQVMYILFHSHKLHGNKNKTVHNIVYMYMYICM